MKTQHTQPIERERKSDAKYMGLSDRNSRSEKQQHDQEKRRRASVRHQDKKHMPSNDEEGHIQYSGESAVKLIEILF